MGVGAEALFTSALGLPPPWAIEELKLDVRDGQNVTRARTFQESIDLFRIGHREVDANPDGIDFTGPLFEAPQHRGPVHSRCRGRSHLQHL